VNGQITVEAPKCGEVRVRVVANALCHTDVYTWEGSDPGVASALYSALREPYECLKSFKRTLREH
jgi:NADPH:quinone reductase-like Zn-dependent oxidoreductase